MIDQQAYLIENFRGLYYADTKNSIPKGYQEICQDLQFVGNALVTRNLMLGSDPTSSFGVAVKPIIDMIAIPKRDNTVGDYLLVEGADGKVYESTNGHLLFDFAGTGRLSALVIANNRMYFSVYGSGDGVKVSDSQFTAGRAALGARVPITPVITPVNAAAAGKIEAGPHTFACAFETASGFITKPGAFVAYTATGGFKADLSTIPVGPAGTVARHILASKVIRPYNGDPQAYEFFFVPGGRIGNNVATTLTVDFYDTELVSSADYLLDQRESLPDCNGFCLYHGRMVVWSGLTVGLSDPGLYESFSEIDGFISQYADIGGTIQFCFELHDTLYIVKDRAILSATDNGGPPNTWKIEITSDTYGGTSISRVVGTQLNVIDNNYVLLKFYDKIYVFNGRIIDPPLNHNLRGYFGLFSRTFIHVIPKLYMIILSTNIAITGLSDTDNVALVGDYQNGISFDGIRWSTFVTRTIDDSDVQHLAVIFTDPNVGFPVYTAYWGQSNTASGATGDCIFTQVLQANTVALRDNSDTSLFPIFRSGPIEFDPTLNVDQFIDLRIQGDFTGTFTLHQSDIGNNIDITDIGANPYAGKIYEKPVNTRIVQPRLELKYQDPSPDGDAGMTLERIILYGKLREQVKVR